MYPGVRRRTPGDVPTYPTGCADVPHGLCRRTPPDAPTYPRGCADVPQGMRRRTPGDAPTYPRGCASPPATQGRLLQLRRVQIMDNIINTTTDRKSLNISNNT